MPAKKQLAVTLSSLNGGCDELIQQAVAAEQAGYAAAWFSDTGYPDPLTLAGSVIAATHDIDIGIAVVPASTRTPAVLASSTGTLNDLSKGRFILGLGTSSQTMIEKWHGQDFNQPLARIRETVRLIRSMLAGEKSNFEGKVLRSKGFRIPAAQQPQRIYLAALRPKMLELAAEIGDGVVLNLFPRKALPKIMEHIEIGAKRGGKTLSDIEVICRYQVAAGDDNSEELAMFRGFFGPYFATPVYNQYLAWCGYPEIAEEITAAWAAKDRERTFNAFSNEMVESIAIVGSEDECQAIVRDQLDNGINTAMITPASANADKRHSIINTFGIQQFSL